MEVLKKLGVKKLGTYGIWREKNLEALRKLRDKNLGIQTIGSENTWGHFRNWELK